MSHRRFPSALAAVAVVAALACGRIPPAPAQRDEALPAATSTGPIGLEAAIARRRSLRQFDDRALDRQVIGQLLWAAQGIVDPGQGRRTSPSAGGLYPLELYVALPAGTYRYVPRTHALQAHLTGDIRPLLHAAGLRQPALADAPAIVVITAIPDRTVAKYGPMAERFIAQESGHAAQNLLLQATVLGLGGVPIGGFESDGVRQALHLATAESPYYLIPVGYPVRSGD
jgi:SagB-type dehydrogenase family enzyme